MKFLAHACPAQLYGMLSNIQQVMTYGLAYPNSKSSLKSKCSGMGWHVMRASHAAEGQGYECPYTLSPRFKSGQHLPLLLLLFGSVPSTFQVLISSRQALSASKPKVVGLCMHHATSPPGLGAPQPSAAAGGLTPPEL